MSVDSELDWPPQVMNVMTRAILSVALGASLLTGPAAAGDQIRIANGLIESTMPVKNGVRSFKGIPFAQPPIGERRWREPEPVEDWTGIRNADQFGPRCMQRTGPGADYWFRSNGMSEDCLYVNVWTSARTGNERLPVLVYIFGGGFQNGDGSEPRYDGESMARHGLVAVSVNYRTNIFGFFAHPELTRESPHKASGNYGLLDQVAALRWVQRNIAAFGGDPARVTIAGESAGSLSVSALMASPLSKHLMAAAIGESGALISTLPPRSLAETEADGRAFAEGAGSPTLAALRAMSAETIQERVASSVDPAGRGGAGAASAPRLRFSPNLDGYFLPRTLIEIYGSGEQAKIPLLAGSNSEEMSARTILGQRAPTADAFADAVRTLYGTGADQVLQVYAAKTPDEVVQAATDLASARFIGHGTWKWTELQMTTGGRPVYRYFYTRIRPPYLGMPGQPPPAVPGGGRPAPRGAVHSAEIQYAMGNLDLDPRYSWEPDDRTVSEALQKYFVNFIKTGNPNGPGLADWPAYEPTTKYMRMRIDVASRAEPETDRARYQALDQAAVRPQ